MTLKRVYKYYSVIIGGGEIMKIDILKESLRNIISRRILEIWDECDKLSQKNPEYDIFIEEVDVLKEFCEKNNISLPVEIISRY